MFKKSLLFACLIAAMPSLLWAAVSFPPLPDLTNRENYVEWYEKASDVPAKDNAYDLYAQFMPGLVGSDVDEGDWPEFAGMLTDPKDQAAAMAHSVDGGQTLEGPSPWFPDRRGSWEQSHKRTQEVLKKFAAAAKRKYVMAPPSIDGAKDDNANRMANILLAHAASIRQCTQGVLESAWRIGKGGDVDADRFIAAIETSIRAGTQFQKGLFSVEQLTGYSIRSAAYRHLRWAYAHGVLTEKHAGNIAKSLRKIDANQPDASPCLAGECAILLDNLQYVFGPLGANKLNGNRYREVTGSSITGGNRFGLGARVEADPQGTAAAILAAFQAMDQQMGPGFAQEKNHEISKIAGALVQKNNLTKGMLYGVEGTYARLYTLAAQCEADRRATQVLLEIFAYKAKHKKWPKSLAALDKKLVGKVLKDPFTNKPFKYLINGKVPVLYSCGPDGEDDGGNHDDSWSGGTDFVYWPIAGSEEILIASRLNRVKDKDLTPIDKVGEKLKGRQITVAAEITSISSRPSKKHRQRHSIMLKQGKAELKLYYYEDIAQDMTPRQKLVEGRRIRVIGTVVQEDGKWRIELKNAKDLVLEE